MNEKTNSNKSVAVLLSSWNGEKYISEQLDSILHQTYRNVSIFVRDDGSSDKTISILLDYKKKYNNIFIYQGPNIKSGKSFMELLKMVDKFDYYSFSDQDDIWLPDKIECAIAKMEQLDDRKPILYISTLKVVDEQKKPLGLMHKNAIINKKTALVKSYATGCTMIFNKEARELIVSHMPKKIILHDLWLFHSCIFLGQVVFDDVPRILYRQHANNVVGSKVTFGQKLTSRIRSILSLNTQHYREDEAKELLEAYSDLLEEKDFELIKLLAFYKRSFKHKMRLLFSRDICCNKVSDDIILRIRILLGKV